MNPSPIFVVIAVIIMCCSHVINVQQLLQHSQHKENDRTDFVVKLCFKIIVFTDH